MQDARRNYELGVLVEAGGADISLTVDLNV
jgi:hypothetical protein